VGSYRSLVSSERGDKMDAYQLPQCINHASGGTFRSKHLHRMSSDALPRSCTKGFLLVLTLITSLRLLESPLSNPQISTRVSQQQSQLADHKIRKQVGIRIRHRLAL